MDAALHELVRTRANGRCEYCQIPADISLLPFQIDHIIAEKHGGQTQLSNLAWSCIHCNSFKGPNIAGRDKEARTTRLFNPRQNGWPEHFEWDGPILVGTSSVGRVTVDVLRINLPYRVAIRASLIKERSFPPL
jgi:hypothetical protein